MTYFITIEKMESRCGSVVKGWNEKIKEIKRSRVHSPVRATFYNILF
jgi:hypothetical protein